ncbi:MAG TPA: hypothetical protein VKU00_15540 [Chthonomonadaceae bacterium]|nr:hypothetical protein [Chthonomonadaceae bacterium]
MSKRAMYRIVWMISLLAIIGMNGLFLMMPSQGAATAASDTLVSFTTSDKMISLRHPSNWTPNEQSDHAIATGVEFMPDETTRCVVKTDMLSSILTSTPGAGVDLSSLSGTPGMPNMPTGAQKPPLEAAHDYQADAIREDPKRYPRYAEGKAIKVHVAGLEALFTQFTYRKFEGFEAVEMVGRRITAVTPDRRLSIVATCRKDQAEKLEPVFQKIIDSVQIGQGG